VGTVAIGSTDIVRRVAIIGGGFAGLAAGVELASRGYRVTVLEARSRLGGRAYSFRDDESGEVVDNGQHALMGCYRHTLSFLDRIGATHKLARQPNLYVPMIDAQRGMGAIACAPLPSPLHLLSGVLRYALLSHAEQIRALLAGMRVMAMRRWHDPRLGQWTVTELLTALGQSPNARRVFWDPIAVATLNESPDRAAAGPFAEVLARAFFRSREDSQFLLPKVGLSDLYTDDARRHLETHDGRVALRSHATALTVRNGRVTSVQLRDGTEIATDACICAVPPRALAALLPETLRTTAELTALDTFDSCPIVSVHLWFDRPILASAFVGLLGTTTQWAFNRNQLVGASTGRQQCISAVISAGRDVVEWPGTQIADTVVSDLRILMPAARAARVVQSVVVKEKRATISATPAAERLRPPTTTPAGNLFLAGDWINTSLPPTIESAVCSGQRAAALVVENLQVTRSAAA
jgi:hydroxysqualene dehydroxylase